MVHTGNDRIAIDPDPVSAVGNVVDTKLVVRAAPSVTVDAAVAMPIAELWNEAWDELKLKDAALVKKYEERIENVASRYSQLHAVMSAMRTTHKSATTFSGLGKLDRAKVMKLLLMERIEELERGQWKVGFGNNQFAVKDFIKPVVGFIDWSKDYIGKAAEASPYASLAWAGVSLVLPVRFSSFALELSRK
jgi:hypothetical protein